VRLDGRANDVLVRLYVPGRGGGRDLSRVVVTCADITARRRAEAALAREHELLRAVLNAIPDLVCRLDDAGICRGCNPAFAEFFGLREEEVIGRTSRDLFPPAAADAIAAADVRVLAGGRPERLDLLLTAADGRPVQFETVRMPLPGPGGKPVGLIAISRDITARRGMTAVGTPAARSAGVGADVSPGGTVLLADDEPMIRALGRTLLERLGYRVLLAADGEEAVAVFRREGGRVDLVVMDLAMPKLGGREACRQLARINPRVRVLVSTGLSIDPASVLGEPGVRGFVAKPYRAADFAAAVRAAVADK
jgi:PAS domain S-box-containing protein